MLSLISKATQYSAGSLQRRKKTFSITRENTEAWEFMLPYLKNKENWTYPPDVQYYDQLPIQSPGQLFAALAFEDREMLNVWLELDPTRLTEEINRNFPI